MRRWWLPVAPPPAARSPCSHARPAQASARPGPEQVPAHLQCGVILVLISQHGVMEWPAHTKQESEQCVRWADSEPWAVSISAVRLAGRVSWTELKSRFHWASDTTSWGPPRVEINLNLRSRVRRDHVATLPSHSQKYGKTLTPHPHSHPSYDVTPHWPGVSVSRLWCNQPRPDIRACSVSSASLAPIFIGQYQGITHSDPLPRCPNR